MINPPTNVTSTELHEISNTEPHVSEEISLADLLVSLPYGFREYVRLSIRFNFQKFDGEKEKENLISAGNFLRSWPSPNFNFLGYD